MSEFNQANPANPTKYTPVNNLCYWVQFVTPLVYDDSLSLYELVNKVVYKLNEVIDRVNPLGQGIEKVIQDALDEYKVQWEAELQEFQTNINNIITANNEALNKRIDELTETTQGQIQNFINEVNQNLADMNADLSMKIAQFYGAMLETDNANRAWTQSLIEELKNELTGNFPPVIDPTDGLLEDIQTTLNHMWDAWRENALTAAEYDALDLTATEYDDKELTATAYDRYGKILLTPTNTVYSSGVPLKTTAINQTALAKEVGMTLPSITAMVSKETV